MPKKGKGARGYGKRIRPAEQKQISADSGGSGPIPGESGKCAPYPEEVLVFARKYKRPSLCNYYCSQCCPIGKAYVPEVEMKELSAIVLEMLASLNAVDKRKDRLIEITADGKVSGDEIDDFITIQRELERISVTVETLQLWSEKMLLSGAIDRDAYEARRKQG